MAKLNAECTTLDNGVRVVTSTIDHVESVASGIWVGAGARFEAGRVSGISHLIEHLLFKGTRRRSSRDITRAIEGRGGYLNAFTQEESTCYYARVAYDKLRQALDVLSDMYLHPRFAAADVTKERGVVIEEILMYRDQPQHVVHDMLTAALWPKHPMGRSIAGTPKTVSSITRKDILGYKRRTYVPGNTVFSFAGKVSHQACVDLVAKLTARSTQAPVPTFKPMTGSVRQERVKLAHKTIEQTHVALGFRLFGRRDRRRYALKLLSAVLGENMSSRLFQVVREKHGLAYSVHSSMHLYQDTGTLLVSAGLDRRRTGRAIELIVREIAKLKARPVGAGELKRAKDYAVGQMRLNLESTSAQMMWLGDNILSRGRVILPGRVIEALTAVTAEDIQALAGTVLRQSRASLAVVSPEVGPAEAPVMKQMLGGL